MQSGLAIDVKGLTKRFGARVAVDHIDIAMPQGKVWGFLGPNGSGKTTTIRMLCGLLLADEGHGTCLGLDFRTQSEEIKRQVGYMTQQFSFWDDLSVRENLEFVARLYGISDSRRKIETMLERMDLAVRQKQLARQLSGGWKQRLALAACMLHEPKLLLLDEPTAGVDPKARRDFWEEIHALSEQDLTVLVSTHYMDEAERCDRIVYILNGKLVAGGTVPEVIEQSGLSTFILEGADVRRLQPMLQGRPGIDYIGFFGAALHVSGHDRAALERSVAPHRGLSGVTITQVAPSLEDVFIDLEGAREIEFSFRRVGALLRKEFLHLTRDRVSIAMLVILPLMQMTLFGFGINLNPKNLPTAVSIDDPGVFGRSLVAALENSSYFNVVFTTNSPAQARRLLQEGKVIFVVEIPVNFTRDIVRGEPPDLLIEADATDPASGSYALAAFSQLATTALRDDLVGPLASRATTPPPFNLVSHLLYNPEEVTAYNVVPGLLALILTMTLVMITSMAITRERERGTYENLLAMPITPLEIMLGKIMPNVLIGAVQAVLILMFGRLVFGVPMEGSYWLLSGTLIIFIAANLAVGYTVSTLARSAMQAIQIANLFQMPSLLLSGFMFPFMGMPTWARWIGEILPATHFLRIIRGILLKNNDFSEIWPNLWPILVFTLVVSSIALTRFRRTLD